MSKRTAQKTWFWIGGIALLLIIILLVASLLSGSGSSYTSYGDYGGGVGGELLYDITDEARVVTSAMEESAVAYEDDLAASESYIIKTGSITMRVDSVDEAMAQLETTVDTYEGYISYSYIDQTDEYRDGYATVRVTAENFDAAMTDIQSLATSVRYVSASSDDVTEQVVDIQARLSNARAEEASYLDVLDLATSVEDILEVRRYLSQVRETIERYEAQLEYYESVTSMATISIEMTEETSIVLDSATFRPSQAIVDAAQTVVRLAQALVIAVIWIIIVGGAILIPLYILWRIGRAIRRRVKK